MAIKYGIGMPNVMPETFPEFITLSYNGFTSRSGGRDVQTRPDMVDQTVDSEILILFRFYKVSQQAKTIWVLLWVHVGTFEA